MASPIVDTTFTSGTTITSNWLNGVNDAINDATQDITGATSRTLLAKLADTVSVKDFGAVGDGVTDDTQAIQDAFNVSNRNYLLFPVGTYKITSSIAVQNPVSVLGSGAKIDATSSHFTVLNITSSDVSIDGLEIEGAGNSSYNANGKLIYATGVDNGAAVAPTYISNIVIKNCTLYEAGYGAVLFQYVSTGFVEKCIIHDCGYFGFGGQSCVECTVSNNTISDISPGTSGNRYGAYWSQINSADTVRHPVCDKCTFSYNYIKNVAWEGLDTHGGKNINFLYNNIVNCTSGIVITRADDESSNTVACSIRNKVIGNTFDTCNTGLGIGALDSATDSIYHTNLTVSENDFKSCGTDSSVGGALRIWKTKGTVITGNQFSTSLGNGILLRSDNLRISITNNSFLNTTSPLGYAAAISIPANADANNQTGVISNNATIASGASPSNTLNRHGVFISDVQTGTKFYFSSNDFVDSLYKYSLSSLLSSKCSSPVLFSDTTSVVIPNGSSSASTNVTLSQSFTRPDVLATMVSSEARNIRILADVVDGSTIQIVAETTDGTNVSGDKSTVVTWSVVGF